MSRNRSKSRASYSISLSSSLTFPGTSSLSWASIDANFSRFRFAISETKQYSHREETQRLSFSIKKKNRKKRAENRESPQILITRFTTQKKWSLWYRQIPRVRTPWKGNRAWLKEDEKGGTWIWASEIEQEDEISYQKREKFKREKGKSRERRRERAVRDREVQWMSLYRKMY